MSLGFVKSWNPLILLLLSKVSCRSVILVQSMLVKPCIKELAKVFDDIQVQLLVGELDCNECKALH